MGLQETLRLLTETKNEAAINVLVPALDHADADIRRGALQAVLQRRSHIGQREVLRRLDRFDPVEREIIGEKRGRMSLAVRDAILGTDPHMCANGCQAIEWFREYDLVPAMINALEDKSNPNVELVAATLVKLAELLYRELASPRDYSNRRDPQLVRRQVIASLEKSLSRYKQHERDEIIEAFLLLASHNNATLQKVLIDPYHAAYLKVVDSLLHSPRPGVMRLVLNQLDEPQAPTAALSVAGRRTDAKFVEHLLNRVGREPSETMRRNLKRIENIAWVASRKLSITEFNDDQQYAAVQLVMNSSMKRVDALQFVEEVLDAGSAGGRQAAIVALAQFNGAKANALALDTLRDTDPVVQAEAVRQIRHRGIPGAIPRLIDLIESPHEEVRKAARENLTEFSFDRFLASFDTLTPEVRRTTGALVRKIDADVLSRLATEMQSKARTRRMRAIHMTMALEAAAELEAELTELLHDEDHLVRVDAARALAAAAGDLSQAALLEALGDRSVIVQEAAAEALAQRGVTQSNS